MSIDQKRREYNRRWVAANQDRIRAYREATKEKRNARRRELYRQDPSIKDRIVASEKERRKRHPYRRYAAQYGVSEDALEVMADAGCMACGAGSAYDVKVKLHFDHDHETGKFRGVLCQSCNLALGHLYDDPFKITGLLNYLMERGGGSDE